MTCSSCLGLVPSDKMSAMFASLRHFIGWVISAFCSRPGADPQEPGLAPTAPCVARQAITQSPVGQAEIVLDSFEKAVAGMEEAPHPSDFENCGRVASRWLSALLEVAFQS